jgi:16S rRNA (cytosine1402-N4)-methyltransferase
MDVSHVPVLLEETIAHLSPHPGGAYIDCTVGSAGHSRRILEGSSPGGKLLGLDADPEAIAVAAETLSGFADRVTLVNTNFRHVADVAKRHGFTSVDGILMDLGLSSRQLAEGAGFSFAIDAPLDMRYDPTTGVSAAEVVNEVSESELADILYTLAEETAYRRIARAIANARSSQPIRTSGELAAIVARVQRGRGRIHPATKTFQALRIYVNAELESLEATLPQAIDVLKPGGVLAVISFHSLEDRIVKRFFQRESKGCICPPEALICSCGHTPKLQIVTKKAIMPGPEETRRNSRSRSARLRVARRLPSAE